MLKRLELVGFKSFAESTRLDFSPGITAIVGPNGSGKSNIIDAVRWILGEQSAKSLRGGGMTDVIFNGTSGRKSLGMAEVSMLFDNRKRILSFDADEVQITRRVYRDGTGEYQINQQPHRLKDIKELFLGSGLGGDSYSIISQGRVETLLNASNVERRFIFEEAAGISRFRVKKLESLRKLEKLESDFEKIHRLVQEAENTYRKVKQDAAKALKHREYSERLRSLRLDLGLRDYHTFAGQQTGLQQQVQELQTDLEQVKSQHSQAEAQRQQWEQQLQELETTYESKRLELQQVQAQVLQNRSILEHESERDRQLEKELQQSRQLTLELTWTKTRLTKEYAEISLSYREAAEQLDRQRSNQEQYAEQVAQLEAGRLHLQGIVQSQRQEQVDAVRQAGMLQTQAANTKQELERLLREREQRYRRVESRRNDGESLEKILREMDAAGESLQAKLSALRDDLSQRLRDRETLQRLVAVLEQEQDEWTLRRSEMRGRIDVLEQLEHSQEGLGLGVRQAMQLLQEQESDPTFRSIVLGIVADHLQVPRDIAPLIDLALGDTAQRFVATDVSALDQYLADRQETFSGRVGFIPLNPDLTPLDHGDETSTADRWVTCEDPRLKSLPTQLLGNVRIVPTLSEARQLTNLSEMRSLRFVTKAGELLEPDGTLTVGRHHAETGLLSRRSELKELRLQAKEVDLDLQQVTERLEDLHQRIAQLGNPIRQIEAEIAAITGQAGDLQSRIQERRLYQQRITDDLTVLQTEIEDLSQQIEKVNLQWREFMTRSQVADERARELQNSIADLEQRVRAVEELRNQLQQQQTNARIEFARDEEHLESLQNQHERLQLDLQRAEEEFARVQRHTHVLLARRSECQMSWLHASAGFAMAMMQQEKLQVQVYGAQQERDQTKRQLQAMSKHFEHSRETRDGKVESFHLAELELQRITTQLQQTIQRLLDEHQIDLPAEYVQWQVKQEPFGEIDRPAIEAEIQTLKDKIRRQGAVDPESIDAQLQAENRYNDLKKQYEDLLQARQGLREIIERINVDSRTKLTETFQNVRSHFQELYRKLFGGGQADLVIEEGVDVLDAGVEIMAQPPGKGLMPLTLLSGGEKALTAVALVLAIFRSKPSPFCLLDEVDAALDEANTARLGGLIREFTDLSQFILITHRKRTISCADVLHGVTMQESGVSQLISVRFEEYQEAKLAA